MIEHIKSVILFILVAMSLVLTVAIWNYQPQYEPLSQMDYLEETQLDGVQLPLRALIEPQQIVFHNYQEKKELSSPSERHDFYEQMMEWDFASVDPYLSTRRSMWQRSVEVIYPADIPLDLITQLFNIERMDTNYDQTFDRIIFQLSQANNDIRVTFASSKHDHVLNGLIQSSVAYEQIEEKINDPNLTPVSPYAKNDFFIYLPIDGFEVESHTLLTDSVDLLPLRNVLFKNPSLVRLTPTSGISNEEYYTDGTRALVTKRVFQNERVMEYVNPLTSEIETMSTEDVIRRSVNFTNDHYGWTDEYLLDEVFAQTNTVKFRMYYGGYPIFENNDATDITQTWTNNELYEMTRPLFQTSTQFHNEQQEEVLQSGSSVIQFLESQSDNIMLNGIENIRVGYQLEMVSDISNVLLLKPEWHIKYFGEWRPLSYFTSMLIDRGED